VTDTAATLAGFILASRTLTPIRSSIAWSVSSVNGALFVRSPVPGRPTTRP
jgi:hypothetical protein